MTSTEVKEDTDAVREVLRLNGSWMKLPRVRKQLPPEIRKRANVQNCLNKLMLSDKAERKLAVLHDADGKYVYRYRSGAVVH